MLHAILKLSGIFLLCILMLSCSNTRYLAEGEALFTGSKIKIVDSITTKNEKKNLEIYLSESVRPIPNKSFLGLRYKLFFYNIAGTPKREEGGLRNWIKNKLGEEPVLASKVNIDFNNKLLKNQLQNLGYFQADALGVLQQKNKKAFAEFEVTTNKQYKIKHIIFPHEKEDDSKIAQDIARFKENSLLKEGAPYNFETINLERTRIDNDLKEIGYYYFNPEYLLMVVDTGIGNHEVDVSIRLKWDEMPRNAYEQFRINDVVIVSNFRNTTNTTTSTANNNNSNPNRSDTTRPAWNTPKQSDTLIIDGGIKLVDRRRTYRPVLFYQAMQLKPGELYNRKDHNLSLNRLITMGNFKFVKSEIAQVRNEQTIIDTTQKNNNSNTKDTIKVFNASVQEDAKLNLLYYLTPQPKKGLNAEILGFTQNDSRAGSRASVSWRNRNTFKGGELFSIKVSGGFEIQYGGNRKRPNTYNAGLELSLNIPRFLIPIIEPKPNGTFVPRTLLNIGYNYSLRSKLYLINSATTSFGYNWKEDIKRDHKLFPISITYVRTDTIDKNANFDVDLSNLVFNGIILGSTYEYSFNSKADGNQKRHNYFVSVIGDVAGNSLGLLTGAKTNEPPEKIFGSVFAQYAKVQADFRYYYKINPSLEWASRFLIGIGLPYGNSQHMPNVKQFFSGGSNSLRGFPSRLVGPGTYDYRQGNYIEVLGDQKLEFSTELRQKLYRFIHLGAFVDAGNIWLLRDNPKFPGGKISNSFYKELGVDVGLGLRFDFSILILRLDFAGPIRKPWLPEGKRWVLGAVDVGNPEWRKENLFFQVAIGYPF